MGWDDESPLANDAASGSGVRPLTLRLVSGEKWVVLQSLEARAAAELASRLQAELGIPACGEEANRREPEPLGREEDSRS